MTKFYCITRDKLANPKTVGLLKAACKSRGIEFVPVYSQKFDFSEPNHLEQGSILYKVSIDSKSGLVFKHLVRDDVVTVFKNTHIVLTRGNHLAGPLLMQKHGLPSIKTIVDVPNDKKLLVRYVKQLGGFPIIIKAMGGSHGIGVMRLDSIESLTSVVDYLKSLPNQDNLVLKSYVDYNVHARLIVLNHKVIDSITYKRLKDDFRTNASHDVVVTKAKFSQEINDSAVKAVSAYGADFGGVDILIDKKSRGYIAEVNIPCYFPRAQELTGVDIAGQLVDHLLNKAKGLS